jgi:hypothetical protein
VFVLRMFVLVQCQQRLLRRQNATEKQKHKIRYVLPECVHG